jgi:hypothetical protein
MIVHMCHHDSFFCFNRKPSLSKWPALSLHLTPVPHFTSLLLGTSQGVKHTNELIAAARPVMRVKVHADNFNSSFSFLFFSF